MHVLAPSVSISNCADISWYWMPAINLTNNQGRVWCVLNTDYAILHVLLQFSLLNGGTHDMWLQQGHEGQAMGAQMRAKCEVLSCKKIADAHRRRAPSTSEA